MQQIMAMDRVGIWPATSLPSILKETTAAAPQYCQSRTDAVDWLNASLVWLVVSNHDSNLDVKLLGMTIVCCITDHLFYVGQILWPSALDQLDHAQLMVTVFVERAVGSRHHMQGGIRQIFSGRLRSRSRLQLFG